MLTGWCLPDEENNTEDLCRLLLLGAGPVARACPACSAEIFPLFYGKAGDSHFVIASKAAPLNTRLVPQHPRQPDVEVQVGTAKTKARARTATGRGARAAVGKVTGVLAALR
jgi:uncharacterized Zn finger protein (UPF0148 family)